jgi:hypothetical protein
MNLNININRDDATINDYLFCMSEFGKIPNKISLYHNYDSLKFHSYISELSKDSIKTKEIIPTTGCESIINEKHFVKINDCSYISYIQYDKNTDKEVVTDVIIYTINDDVNEIIEKINEFKLDYQQNEEYKFNILSVNSDGLYLEPTDVIDSDYDNFDLYYNDNVIKNTDKILKLLKSKKKGLTIIYGERGTGKTTLSAYLSSLMDRICIFVPSNMIDLSINSNDFRNLIKKYKQSIIIIDDCEIFFSNVYTKSNIFTNNLVQMVDGITSDVDNLHIFIILNVEDITYIDHTLLECNNLVDVLHVDKLKKDKVEFLSTHLKKKIKNTQEMKLIDVINKKPLIKSDTKIGF